MLFLGCPYTDCGHDLSKQCLFARLDAPKHLNLAGDSQNCHISAKLQLWQKRICLTQGLLTTASGKPDPVLWTSP